ncbi:MAG: DUF6250 domain-containing protein [Massilia sp.]
MLIALAAAAAINAAAPAACTDWGKQGKQLYADDFSGTLDHWVPEFVAKPGSGIAIVNGKAVLDVANGATLWFKHELSGNLLITYKRKVIVDGGKNDRLSDFNHFWMATDPGKASLFTRDGTFEQYDNLSLYYLGMGGNTNKTTRFRKYGGGERALLTELNDTAHLLRPNHEYAVQIAVYKGCTRVLIDGEEYVNYRDPAPLTHGYFGFRTTWSRQEVDDFKIYQLE